MCTSKPEKTITLDTCGSIGFHMNPPLPQSITPEKLPTPWLADSEWLLEELTKTRESVLTIPVSLNNASHINSVIDRIWRLEQTLRYLLHLHRDGQRAFAKKRNVHMTKATKKRRTAKSNVISISA